MAAPRSLRVGILGAGKIALDHVAALHALDHEVAAGCSTGTSSRRWRDFASAAPEARFEPDAELLLADSHVDAVVACLPWNLTEKWLPKLLSTPKPVLMEKPIALSTKALGAVLDRSDIRLENKFVGFNRRFYAPVQRVKKRLDQGGLKSVEITVSESVDRLVERHDSEIIPHILAYSSCHILDAALYLLGPMTPVSIYGYQERGYPAPFRSMNGLLRTRQGVPVVLSVNAEDPVPVGIRFRFDDRTAWLLSPMERLVACRGYEVLEPTPEVRIRRYNPKPFLESIADSSTKPGFVEQMRAFTTGEGREIAATPMDSMRLLGLIESIQQAAI
jgi:predicted dehydrogenase